MSSRSTAARICGEQDCDERTSRPNHPLCLTHYRVAQAGDINECPNCTGIYKPSEYSVCRECYRRSQHQSEDGEIREHGTGYGGNSRGWDRQPQPEAQTPAPVGVVQAVNRVRENITTHRQSCENHETNTIQYLIMPMLKGLGWDDHDPDQVVMEYKPAGRQRHRRAIAVDVALMDKGSPVAFIEAKRLNREYTDDYMDQLGKYAAHLEDGKTAVLTNGQFWIVCTVSNGQPIHRDTINVAAGEADDVAAKLHTVIGRSAGKDNGKPLPTATATNHQATPDRDTLVDNLRQYRQREARRRGVPPYFVLTNEVISLIAEGRPTDLLQLGAISGVGPATVEQHGDAVIAIVLGQ